MLKKLLLIVPVFMLYINAPVFAQSEFWWHSGASGDVNDPANWTDRNASTDPTTPGADPSGTPRDIVRIGSSWGSEDLNANGTLDAGEDLNGNGVIDDPVPDNVIGTGGYYGSYGDPLVEGGGVDVAVDPVLSETYVSRHGDAYGGWWFVVNAPNILTLEDGAYLIMNRDNCNLRNGGRLEVQGRSDTDGPSLVVARNFRIAENGSITEASHETSQLRINGTGWVQSDPSLWPDLFNFEAAAFMIGTPDEPGTMPRGEIIIEDDGRLEILQDGVTSLYISFGNADTSVNQIIIRDNGELWFNGDAAIAGSIGGDLIQGGDQVSLQDLIDMNLITNDQGGQIEVSGTDPAVVKATGITGVEYNQDIPLTFTLNQNYPNPFNPTTKIEYSVAQKSGIKLEVFDIMGRAVAVLLDEVKEAGNYSVEFNGSNLSSGFYMYKLTTDNNIFTKKMLLLK